MITSQLADLLPSAPAAALRAFAEHLQRRYDGFIADLASMDPGSGWTLLLAVRGKKLHAMRIDENGEREICAVNGTMNAVDIATLGNGLVDQDSAPESTMLEFGTEQAVVRTLRLPTNDANHITAILRNRIERLGPWPASQAIFGHHIVTPARDGHPAEICVAVAGRAFVDATVASLDRAGIKPSLLRVSATGSTPAIVLRKHRTEREQAIAGQFLRRYKLVNAVMIFLLIASAGFAFLSSQRLAAVESRFDGRMLAAFEAGKERAVSTEIESAQILIARRSAERPVLEVFKVVTRSLPDDASLTSLTIAGSTVSMTGDARDPPALIGALQSSSVFQSAVFSAPTVQSDDGHNARFSISAQLATAGAVKP